MEEFAKAIMDYCEICGEPIDAEYDDNYNFEHTRIGCPDCGHWQDLEESNSY